MTDAMIDTMTERASEPATTPDPTPDATPLPDLSGRLVVVTGASRGIGYFTALHAAAAGAHVVAVARTVGGLEELDDAIKAAARDGAKDGATDDGGAGGATLVPLDVTDGPGIDRLGAALAERWGRCDALIANAGVLGTISPIGHIEAKSWDEVMAVNVTAVWRLARTLDPLLTRTADSRALILSSGAAHSCKPYWGAYAASKAAVEAMARVWAKESARTPLRVNCVNPGATRTQMRARAMPGEDPATLPEPRDVARSIVALLDPAIDRTGQIYDVRAGRWLEYAMPEPA